MRKGQNAGRRRRPASRFHSPSSAIIITHAVYLRLGITSPLAAGNRPLASVLSRSSAVVYNHARIPRLLIPFYHGKHETNDCRYRSTRLLNARQNQNGRGGQRETWRAIYNTNSKQFLACTQIAFVLDIVPLFAYQHNFDRSSCNKWRATFHPLFHSSPPNSDNSRLVTVLWQRSSDNLFEKSRKYPRKMKYLIESSSVLFAG